MRGHTRSVYARADGGRTRAMRKRIPNHSTDYKRIDPEAIWPRSLWQCSLSIRLSHHVLTVLTAQICND